jgi:hypothetical protein
VESQLVRATADVEGVDRAVALAHATTDPQIRAELLAALTTRAPDEQTAGILRDEAIAAANAVTDPVAQTNTWKALIWTPAIRATGRPAAALTRLTTWQELVTVAPPEFVRAVADELAILGVLAHADA